MSRRTAKIRARAKEIAELKQENHALLKISNSLINTCNGLRDRLEYSEKETEKVAADNLSMARAIRELQKLDVDRTKIINNLYSRINSLEAKPVGLMDKLRVYLGRNKVPADG